MLHIETQYPMPSRSALCIAAAFSFAVLWTACTTAVACVSKPCQVCFMYCCALMSS